MGKGKKKKSLAIFWDYENCALPKRTNAREIIRSLLDRLKTFGSIEQFNVYSPVAAIPKKIGLSNALSEFGGMIVDCTHEKGKKEVVDHRILVDMLTFVMDHPNRKGLTIVLVSGDGDFVRAIEQVKARGCKVVVVLPPLKSVNSKLKKVACTSFLLKALLPRPHKSPTPPPLLLHNTPSQTLQDQRRQLCSLHSYNPNHLSGLEDPEEVIFIYRSRAPSPEDLATHLDPYRRSSVGNASCSHSALHSEEIVEIIPEDPSDSSWGTFCTQLNNAVSSSEPSGLKWESDGENEDNQSPTQELVEAFQETEQDNGEEEFVGDTIYGPLELEEYEDDMDLEQDEPPIVECAESTTEGEDMAGMLIQRSRREDRHDNVGDFSRAEDNRDGGVEEASSPRYRPTSPLTYLPTWTTIKPQTTDDEDDYEEEMASYEEDEVEEDTYSDYRTKNRYFSKETKYQMADEREYEDSEKFNGSDSSPKYTPTTPPPWTWTGTRARIKDDEHESKEEEMYGYRQGKDTNAGGEETDNDLLWIE